MEKNVNKTKRLKSIKRVNNGKKVSKQQKKANLKIKTGGFSPKVIKKKSPQKPALAGKIKQIRRPIDVKPYQAKKNEAYMSKKQLEHFRMALLKWKWELMAGVDRTMHHMQDEAANYPDPVDRATQEEGFNLELRARDRERKLLWKIEETLNRIGDNDYGYCDDCGAEIGVRRLEARPTATQCIECKTIAEIREKQLGESG